MKRYAIPTLDADGKPRVVKLPNGVVIPAEGAHVVWDSYMRRRHADGSVKLGDAPESKPAPKTEKPAVEKSAAKPKSKPAKKSATKNEVK